MWQEGFFFREVKGEEREREGKYDGSSWALWGRVVVPPLSETVLGISGLGESEDKVSCGRWGGQVAYVRQVGHQKYHRHQDHKKWHHAFREVSYRT